MQPFPGEKVAQFLSWFPPHTSDFLGMSAGAVPGVIEVGAVSPDLIARGSGVRSAVLFSTNEPNGGAPKALVAVAEIAATGGRVVVASHDSINSKKEAMRGVYAILAEPRLGTPNPNQVPAAVGRAYPPAMEELEKIVIQVNNANVWQVIAGLPLPLGGGATDRGGAQQPATVLHVDSGVSEVAAKALADLLYTRSNIGIFIATCPWGHCQVKKIVVEAIPSQTILGAVGMQFTSGYARGAMTNDMGTTFRAMTNKVVGLGKFTAPAINLTASQAPHGGFGTAAPNPAIAAERKLFAAFGGLVGTSFPNDIMLRYLSWFGPSASSPDACPDFLKTNSGAVAGTIVVGPPSGVRASVLFSTKEANAPKALVALGEVLQTGVRIIAAAHDSAKENNDFLRAAYAILSEPRGCGGGGTGPLPPLAELERRVVKVDNNNITSVLRAITPGSILYVDNSINSASAQLLRQAVFQNSNIGIFIATCPWGHCQVKKIVVEAIPSQTILGAVGMQFTSGYARGAITGDRYVTCKAEIGTFPSSLTVSHQGGGGNGPFPFQHSEPSTLAAGADCCLLSELISTSQQQRLAAGQNNPATTATVDCVRNVCEAIASGVYSDNSMCSAPHAATVGGTMPSSNNNNTNTTSDVSGAIQEFCDSLASPEGLKGSHYAGGPSSTFSALLSALSSLTITSPNGAGTGGGCGTPTCLLDVMGAPSLINPCKGPITAAEELLNAMLLVPGVKAPKALVPPMLLCCGGMGNAVYNNNATTATTVNGGSSSRHSGVKLSVRPRSETTGGHRLISTGYYAIPGEPVYLDQLEVANTTIGGGSDGYAPFQPSDWAVRIGCHSDVPPEKGDRRRLRRITNEKRFTDLLPASASPPSNGPSQQQSSRQRSFISNAFGGLVYLFRVGGPLDKTCTPFEVCLRGGLVRNIQIFSSTAAWEAYECRVLSPQSEQYSPNFPPNLHNDPQVLASDLARIDAIAGQYPPMMEGMGEHAVVSFNTATVLKCCGSSAAVAAAQQALSSAPPPPKQGQAIVPNPSSSLTFVADRVAACTRHLDFVLKDHHLLSQRQYAIPNAQRLAFDVSLSCGFMHSGYPVMGHADPSEGIFLDCERLVVGEGNWGLYHEFGHNHQRPAWTFDGTLEVTVNLFTLHAMLRRHNLPAKTHSWVLNQKANVTKYLADVADSFRRGGSAATAVSVEPVKNLFNKVWCEDPGVALCTYVVIVEAFGWEPLARVFRDYEVSLRPDRKADSWSSDVRRSQFFLLISEAVGQNVAAYVDRVWGVPILPEVLAAAMHLRSFTPAPLFG